MGKTLHILNGDSLVEGVKSLKLKGDILVWREMLCAGPVYAEVGGERFFNSRSSFLSEFYNISEDTYRDVFASELEKVIPLDTYSEVNLWFEYDLFCHINMLGALAWISQHQYNDAVYHICSGRVKGEKELMGLSQLSYPQLQTHFENRKLLNTQDLEMADEIWQIYCREDHNAMRAKIKQTTSFDYLSNCLKSHIERFPNKETGLNVLEAHILRLIDTHLIKTEHQLCGYVLSRQGYYGYGDSQILKAITYLRPFFTTKEGELTLNETGHQLLNKETNAFDQLQNDSCFGGAKKYDWQYDAANNQLVKR